MYLNCYIDITIFPMVICRPGTKNVNLFHKRFLACPICDNAIYSFYIHYLLIQLAPTI